MATLPSQHPTVSLHLTDVTLTPLITSSSSPSHLDSLTSLAHSALTSQAAVQRANLGRPQRIMVEYPDRGPVVLQSYLEPRGPAAAAVGPASYNAAPAMATALLEPPNLNGAAAAGDATSLRQDDTAAPVLIGVVVAGSADDVREARRAASRLERAGREFQREWTAEDTKSDVPDVPQ